MLDAAGDIDEAKVTAAVAGLVEQKPHYRAPRPDLGMGYRSSPIKQSGGWEEVLRGTSRRPGHRGMTPASVRAETSLPSSFSHTGREKGHDGGAG